MIYTNHDNDLVVFNIHVTPQYQGHSFPCWMLCPRHAYWNCRIYYTESKYMLTLSGTHYFTPFGEFMISPIHVIYITEFASLLTLITD